VQVAFDAVTFPFEQAVVDFEQEDFGLAVALVVLTTFTALTVSASVLSAVALVQVLISPFLQQGVCA